MVNPFRRREKYIALAKNRIVDNPVHSPFIVPAVLSLVLVFIYAFTTRHGIWLGATAVSDLCYSECSLKNCNN